MRKPFAKAYFGKREVVVHDLGSRFMVGPGPLPVNESDQDFELLHDALKALQKSTGWNCNGTPGNDLLGALYLDWEPAHIFVAMNIYQLEQYAKGEWAHFLSPGMCMWELMRLRRP